MKKIQAQNYVIKNARFMPDAPETPYFVRFPRFLGGKVFFSADTQDLVEQVFQFGKTKIGRELWNSLSIWERESYLEDCTDHDTDTEDDE